MEEETTINPTIDAALQKKHQAMLDRLSNRHQNRTTTSAVATTATTTASFLTKFTESKNSIESELSNSSNLTTNPSLLKSHLLNISSSISSLEQLIAENSYTLPSYELRSCLKTVSDLKQTLDNQNSSLIPKKKFSFKNKTTAPLKPKQETEIKLSEIGNSKESVGIVRKFESPGIRNKENESLFHNFKLSPSGEFSLENLKSCEIRLVGCVNALFISKLFDCKVYVGPVIGSTLIEGAENCVFVLASHQIRIHDVKGCDFYLRVRSRPIIEDCSRVRFGPYCLRYDGIGDDLKNAGLDEESGNWSNVDDFKWLRAVQSPNWCVLDESERIGVVEVKAME